MYHFKELKTNKDRIKECKPEKKNKYRKGAEGRKERWNKKGSHSLCTGIFPVFSQLDKKLYLNLLILEDTASVPPKIFRISRSWGLVKGDVIPMHKWWLKIKTNEHCIQWWTWMDISLGPDSGTDVCLQLYAFCFAALKKSWP